MNHGGGRLTLADYAESARRRLEPGVWDFVAGGAGDERTLAANSAAFDRVRLRPRMLSGVAEPALGTRVLGRAWAAPLGVAPMAYHTLLHPDGEVATAAAAGAAGVPFVVSTFAGRTFDDIAAATASPLWLQVYCFRDRGVTRGLVERAAQAGFEALVLTVDAPRLGRRLRDVRNGFRLPPGIEPANLPGTGFSSPGEHARTAFDPALDWTVVEWLRSISPLPVLIKGVLTASDTRRAIRAGADGVVVSNHGGRQLDGAPATLEVLPEIAAEVSGRCAVLLDGGVRRGGDVLAALALGADAVLLGRPVLHGLAVAGRDGVADVLGIVNEELADAMALSGCPAVADAGPPLVVPAGDGRPAAAVRPRPAVSEGLAKEDLHSSVSDPVLDTMNFLNEITHRYPDAISFAPGRPYDGFFDPEQLFAHIRRYMDHLAASGHSPAQVRDALFQYGPTSGQIRELVAKSLRLDENIDVPAESVVVTVGCQEAMLLALRALVAGPDDALLVSSPCYVGITGAARLLDVEPTAVEEGPDGFRCADLETALRAERGRGRRPRAFYVIPDHSNPSGATMGLEERHELLKLAAREDFLILEDSPYRLVSPGRQLPTLKSLDRERRVIQLGSFAKSLFPGARVGYAVADQLVTDRAGNTSLLADELTRIKSMVTVNTSALSQAVVGGMLLAGEGGAAEHNTDTARHYGEAMRATIRELDAALPEAERAALGVRWNRPSGGFFLTVTVPFPADNAALARSAEEFGVIWTPMSYFYPQGGGERTLRLSVSYLTHADIHEGTARLARFIRVAARH
ncbi:aminotransferase class I/II-fold pyridoxal phosphate-dependent enzyme [Streptomyces sp. NL15-2K]|uniref:aminotransferase class I/II-fold pyridoxal phosphate-dependent enzyme n=1 Tax=Streptomyces sp. NL15-2K TaxID=376149 RepID=UPI000F570871|nr:MULTISPECIES: aminotransferase class I/II-fold pyridoxal phosphate-dependent enzyme [Actinomycetes]WKX06851.1 aminotransferase class I/II-fold pyridoxal phosphate-dependent enzyme [Kutzneria buriramensis]GCB43868.1 (S)-2-hydroxy-acid oxidase [Streptomyces sp. NL15-2K]